MQEKRLVAVITSSRMALSYTISMLSMLVLQMLLVMLKDKNKEVYQLPSIEEAHWYSDFAFFCITVKEVCHWC